MTSTPVDPAQRFTTAHPCPICGGGADLPQHQGVRCWGFLSSDGQYIHCTRPEHAGGLLPHDGGETYAHRLAGECRCGVTHAPAPFHAGGAVNGATVGGATADYRYVDADGVVVAIHRRIETAGGKRYVWLQPDGQTAGGVVIETLPLYRLPELLATEPARTVFMTEGEKACEAVRGLNVVATCLGGGAGQRRFGDALAPLAGRTVVVLPDADSPGRAYAARLVAALKAAGADALELVLPGLPVHGDAVEWIAAGGTRERLAELLRAARAEREARQAKARLPKITTADELLKQDFPELRYAVPGLIAEGLTIFAGKPKLGKSWAALGISTAIAAGGYALGQIKVSQGEVLLLALEDGPRRIQARLLQMLGSTVGPAGLYIATDWPRLGAGGVEALDDWLSEHPGCRAVFIDTIAKFRPRRASQAQGYSEDYADADALQKLAQRRGVAIVVIAHLRKAVSDDFVDDVSGTLGLSGGADAVLVLRRERGKAEAMLLGSGRDLERDIDLALVWDEALVSWAITGTGADMRRSAEQQVIWDTLVEMGQPATPKEVADIVGKSYGAVKFLLWKMAQAGALAVSGGRYAPVEEMFKTANPADRANR